MFHPILPFVLRSWNDIRDVSEFQQQAKPIIEATGLIRTAIGEIQLIAQSASGNTGVGNVPVMRASAIAKP